MVVLVTVITSWKSDLKKRRVYLGSLFEGTVHHDRKSQWQGLEAAGHIVSTVGK